MEKKQYELNLGDHTITAQFTNLTEQADGSVMLSSQDTVVLATAVMSKDGKGNPGYFNLTVEYQERYYANGEILGSKYNRREGRPSEEAVLSGRMIDRTIRPLFDHRTTNAIQVVVTVLAVGNADPGILAINAASLALATSDIPWNGPVGAVHVGRENTEGAVLRVGNYIPQNYDSTDGGYTFDLTVCGASGVVNMIEAMAHEVSEDDMMQALNLANEHITKLEAWQQEIVTDLGITKRVVAIKDTPAEVVNVFQDVMATQVREGIFGPDGKKNLYHFEDEWKQKAEELWSDHAEAELYVKQAGDYYHHFVDDVLHEAALTGNKRSDLRDMDTVRPLYAQAGGVSPVLHGSGIFYRGNTHVFSALTLGGPDDAHTLEGMEVKGSKRFMHHYNFPPFSVGQTGRVGGFNRRAIGHGALGEKALEPVIPNKTDFPYTIRLVSETMSSNGSSSQASICASTLALMDGGVPITAPVAGIAMGVMIDTNDASNYKILTDIQGPEDHHGDMDCKVAGTRNGITAIQLDVKVSGVSLEILEHTLEKAKTARLHILDAMSEAIALPRTDISPRAPKITVLTIPVDKIGMVIGSGGKTVNEIRERTGAEISIEDDGTVFCTGKDGAADAAKEIIQSLVKDWEVGEKVEGEVVKIIDGVGVIVKFGGTHEGLVHISELATFRVEKIEDLVKEGTTLPVTVIKVDKDRGRIGLSVKKDNPNFFTNPY